ncbi:MAG: FeoA family protein [Candidatus Binataceae bacterium]|jgi:ferrous iron transport protein A
MLPVKLSLLAPGQTATIGAIEAEGPLFARMAALGLRIGRTISVIRRARMNGPIHIRIGTTDLILRLSEAAKVLVSATAGVV